MADANTNLRVSHLTLSPSNTVTHSIVGYFSQRKESEIVCVKSNGQWLQLLKLRESSLQSVCFANTFGQIRTLNKVTMNNQKDLIAITSNAGKLIILQFDDRSQSQIEMQCFRVFADYKISKRGCRKKVVGHYAKCIQLPQNNEFLFFCLQCKIRNTFVSVMSFEVAINFGNCLNAEFFKNLGSSSMRLSRRKREKLTKTRMSSSNQECDEINKYKVEDSGWTPHFSDDGDTISVWRADITIPQNGH